MPLRRSEQNRNASSLPLVEHTDALSAVETALRNIARDVLGESWPSAKGAPPIDRLQAKQDEARKRRDGSIVSDDLLAFTELHHLTAMIEKNWEQFQPVFDDLQRTRVFFGILADYRNDIAHSRELNEFEGHLLIGASGQLRNQITLYRGALSHPSRFYARIERVSDNFGNTAADETSYTNLRLEVGDQLSFDCRASDPRGRDIEWYSLWRGWAASPFARDWETVAVGDHVNITVDIDEEMVAKRSTSSFG